MQDLEVLTVKPAACTTHIGVNPSFSLQFLFFFRERLRKKHKDIILTTSLLPCVAHSLNNVVEITEERRGLS